ncbi:MAG: hypothetical protein JSS34_01105 [Proteobacteria bacterium]|nr:hypothetical protein [Pseudomonadota bacterium]
MAQKITFLTPALCVSIMIGMAFLPQSTKASIRTMKSVGRGSLKEAPEIPMNADSLRSFITSGAHSPSAIHQIIERSKKDPQILHAFLQKCESDVGYREHIMFYISSLDDQELIDLITQHKDKYGRAFKMLSDFKLKNLAKNT